MVVTTILVNLFLSFFLSIYDLVTRGCIYTVFIHLWKIKTRRRAHYRAH